MSCVLFLRSRQAVLQKSNVHKKDQKISVSGNYSKFLKSKIYMLLQMHKRNMNKEFKKKKKKTKRTTQWANQK